MGVRSSKARLDILAGQMHKLRAACCHPQVGSHGLKKGRAGGSDGMKVLTMSEVLDRLIDDAKNQCAEDLRLVLFYSNPMAAIARLKIQARKNNHIDTICETDEHLSALSCKLYLDALDIADKNASPSLVTGALVVTGNRGFRKNHEQMRSGKALVDWQLQTAEEDLRVWVNFEFQGSAKKLCQIRLRSKTALPIDLATTSPLSWSLRFPKDCMLQVSNAALGGEFVDIMPFSLPSPGGNDENKWNVLSGSWIHRSKLWRIVVLNLHDNRAQAVAENEYVGIEVEISEPTIASDSLQRLHTLHNAVISFRELDVLLEEQIHDKDAAKLPLTMSGEEIRQKISEMTTESKGIEHHQLEYARAVRSESFRELQTSSSRRISLEKELVKCWAAKGSSPKGFWDITWWEDMLVAIQLKGNPVEQLAFCEKVSEAIATCSGTSTAFPAFQDIHGLHAALKLRFEDSLSKVQHGGYAECIHSVSSLPGEPTNRELMENQVCGTCKSDWGQTGPKCGHCIIGDKMKELEFDNLRLELAILDAIRKWCKGTRSRAIKGATNLHVASKFFEVCDAARKEVLAASRLWRIHLDLLNVMDELNSCKTSMRLTVEGEDLTALTDEQKGSIITPVDICQKYNDHELKQATALKNLRSHKSTLSYLKSQSEHDGEEETCMVCLCPLHSDRSVLTCGHSFHTTPCMAELLKKNSRMISCPLRCPVPTKYEDILVANNRPRDDGSQSKRKVKGSWGTKVTAIVSDLLAISDLGEKSIVFSMWEDMLDIVEEALNANSIGCVRASSLARIGKATESFRSTDCFVLLLNVKNGAEGLNLIEASHVVMIEPLLNCGLDSQAIARCHRIGQTKQTTIHRYLIDSTIEIKVDQYRQQHQEEQQEDSMLEGRKCRISAGGIDGGFSSKEELMDMLTLT